MAAEKERGSIILAATEKADGWRVIENFRGGNEPSCALVIIRCVCGGGSVVSRLGTGTTRESLVGEVTSIVGLTARDEAAGNGNGPGPDHCYSQVRRSSLKRKKLLIKCHSTGNKDAVRGKIQTLITIIVGRITKKDTGTRTKF